MENIYMLSNFSTYLQFLDALFVSMCFEEIFNFWNPKFKTSYHSKIKNIKAPKGISKAMVRGALREIKIITDGVVQEFRHSIRKRASFMIVFTSFLLLFCGWESNNHILRNDPSYRSIAATSIISFCYIAVCLNKYLDFGKKKKNSGANNLGFSILYLLYFIVLASLIVFYFYFDEISNFIIKYRYYLSLFALISYIIHMFLSRRKFTSVFINIWHYLGAILYTIIPILFSNYLFNWCVQYPVFIILGFCTWEIFWQWAISRYYGEQYPQFVENKMQYAFSLIEKHKGKETKKIIAEFKKSLYLRISNDPNRSKFYLFNLDMWESSKAMQFLIKRFSKKKNSGE